MMDLNLDAQVMLREIADCNTDAVWAITGIILVTFLGWWVSHLLSHRAE